MDFNKDYYNILEVLETATKEEIKASYRRLVKLHHPDSSKLEEDDRIKLINEAKDVLTNELTRSLYDDFRSEEKKRVEAEKSEQEKKQRVAEEEKFTHIRTRKIIREQKIFIRGTISVKYYGELQDESFGILQKELDYLLTPTEASVQIQHTDMHEQQKIPLSYNRSYSEAELFATRIPQPIHCVVQTETGTEYYLLQLNDIRIRSIELKGITKHDGVSFGELTGEIFAYTIKYYEEEVITSVTECFGPTGNVETRIEGAQVFIRKEFYNPDCTRYWSAWQLYNVGKTTDSVKPPPKKKHIIKESPGVTPIVTGTDGCWNYLWIPGLLFLLFLCFLFPKFFLGLGLLMVFWLAIALIGLLVRWLARWLAILAGLLLVWAIFAAISSGASGRKIPVRAENNASYDTLSTTINPITPTYDTSMVSDSVITHYIRWKDYDTSLYEARLSILVSNVRASKYQHQNMRFNYLNSFTPVYAYMEEIDSPRLNLVYNTFDSLRRIFNLNEEQFANVIVSCIQSIPYYLVLDKSCNPQVYDDEFISNYLAQCETDCCIGNTPFGVRTPSQFIADLKGDCDTRTLLLYMLLKKFDYNVALLTSVYYKHSVIAVHFPDETNIKGLSMNIRNKNYYLWETTSSDLRPGQLAPEFTNLNYWDVSLLNEKK